MNFLFTIRDFVIVLGILVVVHEFGHYIAARLTGVRVETFSFGFGKRLFGKKVGDTDFRVSLIPLGGYVKMAGEEEWDPDNLKPDEFMAKNRAQKIFILFSGSFMNLLLAFIIITVINLTGVKEETYKYEQPKIGYVEKDSPAYNIGIRKGDIIRSIDGRPVPNWKELEFVIGSNPNSRLNVEFEQGGKRLNGKMDVKSVSSYGMGSAGISFDFKTQVNEVLENTPASKGGLKNGDIILAIDQTPIGLSDFLRIVDENPEKTLKFRVKRDKEEKELDITTHKVYYLESESTETLESLNKKLKPLNKALPDMDFNIYRKAGQYKMVSKNLETRALAEKSMGSAGLPVKLTIKEKGNIGIGLDGYSPTFITRYSFFNALKKSGSDCVKYSGLFFSAIKKLIIGKLSMKSFSGPIEIAKVSRRAMESGLSNFFLLIAFISLQLGFVNLFPIPALDGGHLMMYTIEAIVRKEFSQKVKEILINIGFALLITLMAFVILNDITKLLPNGWGSLWPF